MPQTHPPEPSGASSHLVVFLSKKTVKLPLLLIMQVVGDHSHEFCTDGLSTGVFDARLAAMLHLGPVIKTKLVKSAHGNSLRPVIEAKIRIGNKTIKAEFTLADRIHMKYQVLVGQNILKHNFLIDPKK